MNPTQALALLGGLTPAQFMRRYWHKRPLLVRNALSDTAPTMNRAELFALAARDGVQSRLIKREGSTWTLEHGPFSRRSLPPLRQNRWTLLVQGVDLYRDEIHRLIQQFRFVPDARLDDAMVSYASDGGGVGPHFDSYDVFLIQIRGRRRWRIGQSPNRDLRTGVPLRVLRNFRPDEEHVLEAGDMLYLPPDYAHDGVAEGDCMTCSIGFRAPGHRELGAELLHRMADAWRETNDCLIYRDPLQEAVDSPAQIPTSMLEFASKAVLDAVGSKHGVERALGEYLSEPKPDVWFEGIAGGTGAGELELDAKTRMLYDERRIYINGESFSPSARDSGLMRLLADRRRLDAHERKRLSGDTCDLVEAWVKAGWMHEQ